MSFSKKDIKFSPSFWTIFKLSVHILLAFSSLQNQDLLRRHSLFKCTFYWHIPSLSDNNTEKSISPIILTRFVGQRGLNCTPNRSLSSLFHILLRNQIKKESRTWKKWVIHRTTQIRSHNSRMQWICVYVADVICYKPQKKQSNVWLTSKKQFSCHIPLKSLVSSSANKTLHCLLNQ